MSEENQVESTPAPATEARPYLTKAQYAKIHNSSKSLAEVVSRTGLQLASVRAKVTAVNKVLVAAGKPKLKEFEQSPRGRQKASVDDIAAAAEEGLAVVEG